MKFNLFIAICTVLIASIHCHSVAVSKDFYLTSSIFAREKKTIHGFRSLRNAAVLPGSPIVTGTLAQGLSNGISLFSNVLLARVALSWFPQLTNQFPILRPIIVVTEPYLRFFRNQIPRIGGFDISPIPAFFMLDILSQVTVAVGAEIPSDYLITQKF